MHGILMLYVFIILHFCRKLYSSTKSSSSEGLSGSFPFFSCVDGVRNFINIRLKYESRSRNHFRQNDMAFRKIENLLVNIPCPHTSHTKSNSHTFGNDRSRLSTKTCGSAECKGILCHLY